MEPRTLEYIAQTMEGELLHGSPARTVTRICTDSRQVEPGDLFLALAGERFDGHAFLSEAAGRGAAAVVAERRKLPPGFRRLPGHWSITPGALWGVWERLTGANSICLWWPWAVPMARRRPRN
jgi:UDP-N-acetylmuramyl pentapeptide synthase